MPQLEAVSKSKHVNHHWLPYTHYHFAAGDPFAPLTVSEFQKAAVAGPIVFRQSGDGYQPVLLQGIESGKNLLVGPRGHWLGEYVPAYYRSHPFCLALSENQQRVLSFHADSEFVVEGTQGLDEAKPFMRGEALSDELAEVAEFLKVVDASRQTTEKLMALFQELELFIPWTFDVALGTEKRAAEGFYRIDEQKLRALSGEELERMAKLDALAAAYFHLASLSTLPRFERLYDALNKGKESEQPPPIDDKALDVLGHDEGINLDLL